MSLMEVTEARMCLMSLMEDTEARIYLMSLMEAIETRIGFTADLCLDVFHL
jgi:hypothetical protein